MDELMALQPAIVVPGHGEVTDVSLLRDVRDYLDYVRSETLRLSAAGTDLATATATISASARERWSGWANPEWIDFAVRVCYP
jgi:CRISPR/Cas system type I-B associated protein Csh2 (Cas7 group RAMP superfamily)